MLIKSFSQAAAQVMMDEADATHYANLYYVAMDTSSHVGCRPIDCKLYSDERNEKKAL